MRTFRPGEVVYRRIWWAWKLGAHHSPYHTGRVLEDTGDDIRVEVFGRGNGQNRTATWAKDDRLRYDVDPGRGPHYRVEGSSYPDSR